MAWGFVKSSLKTLKPVPGHVKASVGVVLSVEHLSFPLLRSYTVSGFGDVALASN